MRQINDSDAFTLKSFRRSIDESYDQCVLFRASRQGSQSFGVANVPEYYNVITKSPLAVAVYVYYDDASPRSRFRTRRYSIDYSFDITSNGHYHRCH